MNRSVLLWLTAFFIGLFGWLAASRLPGEGAWGAAILTGALAGAVTGRPLALPALLLGMLVAYPVALVLGLIAFLGDGWPIALVLMALLASVGFLGWSLALRAIQGLKTPAI